MPKCRINLYDICHTLELGINIESTMYITACIIESVPSKAVHISNIPIRLIQY